MEEGVKPNFLTWYHVPTFGSFFSFLLQNHAQLLAFLYI